MRKPGGTAKDTPEVKFDNVALKDALAFIGDVTELNIHVDWRTLEGAGIGQDTAIGLRLGNVPAGEVLRLMLREVSPELRYRIETGIVVISTVVPEPVAVIKAYNVEDLTRQNDIQMARSIESAGEPPEGGHRRCPARSVPSSRSQASMMPSNSAAACAMQELVALIQSTVAPYATAGMAVRSFDNKLIITADEAGHQEVAKVLMMLRDRGEGAGDPSPPRAARLLPTEPSCYIL